MKRLFSALLAVAMILSMVAIMLTTVSAAEVQLPYEEEQTITATYVPTTDVVIYSVDIAWGSLAFTYTAEKTEWNPESKVYDVVEEAKWGCVDGANKVTVTNKSNAPVAVTLTNSDVTDGLTLTWTPDQFTVGAATDAETPGVGSAVLTVEGTLAASEGIVTIGKVTITIGAVASN